MKQEEIKKLAEKIGAFGNDYSEIKQELAEFIWQAGWRPIPKLPENPYPDYKPINPNFEVPKSSHDIYQEGQRDLLEAIKGE